MSVCSESVSMSPALSLLVQPAGAFLQQMRSQQQPSSAAHDEQGVQARRDKPVHDAASSFLSSIRFGLEDLMDESDDEDEFPAQHGGYYTNHQHQQYHQPGHTIAAPMAPAAAGCHVAASTNLLPFGAHFGFQRDASLDEDLIFQMDM